MSKTNDGKETLMDLLDYKKRARFVMMKLHKEIEQKDEEILRLNQIIDKLTQRKKES
jgi:hypothetical protein